MLRQRLRTRSSPFALVGRLIVALFAAALAWYGLMVALLALKVSSGSVNSISGYRSAFNFFARLHPTHIASETRAITAAAGILTFLVCAYLARRELPRPYLARRELELSADELGSVVVEPRAIERIAEIVARQDPAVAGARGRYSVDDLSVDVSVRRARGVADTLRGVQERVGVALGEHELPSLPINVTLAGFDRKQRRELN